MVNGLTDFVVTVAVPKAEYEELVRDSERLELIRRFFILEPYYSEQAIKTILGIDFGKECSKESEDK